jgi:hypothetical protein
MSCLLVSVVGITNKISVKIALRYYTAPTGWWTALVQWPSALSSFLSKAKIHDVHVVLLKPYHDGPLKAILPLPPIVRGSVAPALESLVRAQLNPDQWELLVCWFGCSDAKATWECLESYKEDTQFSSSRTSCSPGGSKFCRCFCRQSLRPYTCCKKTRKKTLTSDSMSTTLSG